MFTGVRSRWPGRGTLKRANYSSEGCPATFNAQVVHTVDYKCHNIALGAKTLYFIEERFIG